MRGEMILVTGGAGFIGRAVTRELVARGAGVRILDSLIEQVHGDRGWPAGLRDMADCRLGDEEPGEDDDIELHAPSANGKHDPADLPLADEANE